MSCGKRTDDQPRTKLGALTLMGFVLPSDLTHKGAITMAKKPKPKVKPSKKPADKKKMPPWVKK